MPWYPEKKGVRVRDKHRPVRDDKVEVCLVCGGTGERVAKDIPGYQDGQMRPCVACKVQKPK